MAFTYVPPTPAQMDSLMSSQGVHDAMSQGAQAALEHAQSIAPVVTGGYRDSFAIEESSGDGRAEAHLINKADYAASVEWGNNHGQEAHRVLSQTADWLEGGI